MSISISSFKRGDTFVLSNVVTQSDVVVDITGWTIRCHIRKGPDLVESLTAAITNAAQGAYTLTALPAATELWPVGCTLSADIEYTTASGQVLSTDTFSIPVVADITK